MSIQWVHKKFKRVQKLNVPKKNPLFIREASLTDEGKENIIIISTILERKGDDDD